MLKVNPTFENQVVHDDQAILEEGLAAIIPEEQKGPVEDEKEGEDDGAATKKKVIMLGGIGGGLLAVALFYYTFFLSSQPLVKEPSKVPIQHSIQPQQSMVIAVPVIGTMKRSTLFKSGLGVCFVALAAVLLVYFFMCKKKEEEKRKKSPIDPHNDVNYQDPKHTLIAVGAVVLIGVVTWLACRRRPSKKFVVIPVAGQNTQVEVIGGSPWQASILYNEVVKLHGNPFVLKCGAQDVLSTATFDEAMRSNQWSVTALDIAIAYSHKGGPKRAVDLAGTATVGKLLAKIVDDISSQNKADPASAANTALVKAGDAAMAELDNAAFLTAEIIAAGVTTKAKAAAGGAKNYPKRICLVLDGTIPLNNNWTIKPLCKYDQTHRTLTIDNETTHHSIKAIMGYLLGDSSDPKFKPVINFGHKAHQSASLCLRIEGIEVADCNSTEALEGINDVEVIVSLKK